MVLIEIYLHDITCNSETGLLLCCIEAFWRQSKKLSLHVFLTFQLSANLDIEHMEYFRLI